MVLKTFNPIYFQTICAFLYTSVIAVVPSISSFKMLCILMSIVGIADGIFFGVYLSVAKDTCGGSSKNVNQAMGYYSAFMVLPVTIGEQWFLEANFWSFKKLIIL
jgi:hypothetical protein